VLRALGVLLVLLAVPARADDLVFWNALNEQKEVFDRLVADYNAKKGSAQPHVRLVHQTFDGFADKVAAVIPRGRGPDVFIYPQDRLGGWIQSGNIVEPIDRFLEPQITSRFIPSTLEAMVYRDATYGLPLGFNTVTLIYNKKMVKVPPKTTAEMYALAKKLTNRATGTYGLAYRYSDYYFHAAIQNGFGGRVFDAQLNPVLDSVENVRAMYLMLKWKDDLLPEEPPGIDRMGTLFSEGKAAMIFEGPWFKGRIAPGVDYGMAQLPALSEANGQPMRPWITVEGLYISAQSKQKTAAFEFLDYMTDVYASKVLAQLGYDAPANQRVYLDADVLANEMLSVCFKQARVAVAMPNVPEMTAMWTPATVALSSIIRKVATPEVALTKAQAQVLQGVASLRAPRPPPPK
jgi:arabinogalactan oligomer/maltooligosaccharide transport system substrate-binding protein